MKRALLFVVASLALWILVPAFVLAMATPGIIVFMQTGSGAASVLLTVAIALSAIALVPTWWPE